MSAFRELRELHSLQRIRLNKIVVDASLLDGRSEPKRRWPALADRVPSEVARASDRVKELYFSATPLTRDLYALRKAESNRPEAVEQQQQQQSDEERRGQAAASAVGTDGKDLAAGVHAAATATARHEVSRDLEDVHAWGMPWDPQRSSAGPGGLAWLGNAEALADGDQALMAQSLQAARQQYEFVLLHQTAVSQGTERLRRLKDYTSSALSQLSAEHARYKEEVRIVEQELAEIDRQLSIIKAEGQGGTAANWFELKARRVVIMELLLQRHRGALRRDAVHTALAQQAEAQKELNKATDTFLDHLDQLEGYGQALYKCAGLDELILQDKIRHIVVDRFPGAGPDCGASCNGTRDGHGVPPWVTTSSQLECNVRRRHMALAIAAAQLGELVEPDVLVGNGPRMDALRSLLAAAAAEVHIRLGACGGSSSMAGQGADANGGRADRHWLHREQTDAIIGVEVQAAAAAAYSKYLRPGVEWLKLIHARHAAPVDDATGAAAAGSCRW